MADRYYCDQPVRGDTTRLSGPEAHHLIHVMRAAQGERVVLFDGSGTEFEAEVRRVGRSEVELAILTRAQIDREMPVELVLGAPLPKGDRQRWLVEQCVELGVRRLVPLVTRRAVAQPGPQALARLARTVIEASKQCGRNRLMEIAPPQGWTDWIGAGQHAAVRLLAHPTANPTDRAIPVRDTHPAGPVLMSVGPEGGLTDDEVAQAAAAGWQPVDLGPRILRIETAAVYLVALVAGRLGSA